ncbi:hypothetical protein STURON_00657 [Spiroplasma turonicum]|uniref:Uncharacterized protein n=1 Tax=Spiroplasma turonicum TaxID=216946 RepID=A0A0K1P6H5_9MOLU|nr:hypothetical protein STURON_00657 [Spiroplasma turonicum]
MQNYIKNNVYYIHMVILRYKFYRIETLKLQNALELKKIILKDKDRNDKFEKNWD